LRLQGQLAYLGDHVAIDKLLLHYGDNSVDIAGQAGLTASAALDLRWLIEAPQLAQLWPGLSGTLHSKGQLGGSLLQPQVQATLAANDVKYNDYDVDKATLDAGIDWSGTRPS